MKKNYDLLKWIASGKSAEEFFASHFPSMYPPDHISFGCIIPPLNQPELVIIFDEHGLPVGVKPLNEMEVKNGTL